MFKGWHSSFLFLGTVHYLREGGMGEKMGGPEILAAAKRGVLGKVFVIEGWGGS